MYFCCNWNHCSQTAMWFEGLLFQMFLFLLLAIGISWAKAEKFLYMTLILMSRNNNEWVNLFSCLFFSYEHSFFFFLFCFISSLPCCHSGWSCNTSVAPQENHITCSHICHNKQGSAGCEQGEEDEAFNSGLPAGVCSTQTSCCRPLQSTWRRRSHCSKKANVHAWQLTQRHMVYTW